ncbi:MAG TPA: hypothetical protein DEB39_11105 [Planctomycetaceae bacterium]|nr:hypothetical protein [Planctomycetaceae bacterium]
MTVPDDRPFMTYTDNRWNFPMPTFRDAPFRQKYCPEVNWKRDENEHLVKSACRTRSPLTSVCVMT